MNTIFVVFIAINYKLSNVNTFFTMDGNEITFLNGGSDFRQVLSFANSTIINSSDGPTIPS